MEADDLLCSRNARSKTPLVGRAHFADQPGYPRREVEKEKACIENSVQAFGFTRQRWEESSMSSVESCA